MCVLKAQKGSHITTLGPSIYYIATWTRRVYTSVLGLRLMAWLLFSLFLKSTGFTWTPEVGKIIAPNPTKIAQWAIISHTFGVGFLFGTCGD